MAEVSQSPSQTLACETKREIPPQQSQILLRRQRDEEDLADAERRLARADYDTQGMGEAYTEWRKDQLRAVIAMMKQAIEYGRWNEGQFQKRRNPWDQLILLRTMYRVDDHRGPYWESFDRYLDKVEQRLKERPARKPYNRDIVKLRRMLPEYRKHRVHICASRMTVLAHHEIIWLCASRAESPDSVVKGLQARVARAGTAVAGLARVGSDAAGVDPTISHLEQLHVCIEQLPDTVAFVRDCVLKYMSEIAQVFIMAIDQAVLFGLMSAAIAESAKSAAGKYIRRDVSHIKPAEY